MKELVRDPAWIKTAAQRALAEPALAQADLGEGGHGVYFAGLQAALKRAGVASPTLVVDRRRLEANIAAVRSRLAPTGLALRIVAKSLQTPDLLRMVMQGAGSRRLMVFNGVMLSEIVDFAADANVLTGRPLPAVEVEAFIRRHGASPAPAARPQWLVDSPRRLSQYIQIARAHGAPMRINLEIDVGLHRGGFADAPALAVGIDQALGEPLIEIAGLMGYDAHAAGAASPAEAVERAMRRYATARGVLEAKLGRDAAGLTLNTAGSPTYALHLGDAVANEVSVGSAFVKPAHFDLPSLADLQPACFVAAPVLKAMDPAVYPGLEEETAEIEALDPNARRGFFLYGGQGDSRPVSPPGVRFSRLFGGRAMLCGSRKVELCEDDFVFLRPGESEGTFLQFGDVAVFDGEAIADWWPTFRVAA